MELRRVVLAAAVFTALTIPLVSTAAADQHARTITLGDEETVTATVSNPLEVPDVVRVDFNGEALHSGFIGLSLPGETSGIECVDEENACDVKLGPGESRDVAVDIIGEKTGSSEFMVTVSSDTTGKRAEATIQVTVRGGDTFLAFISRLLGIT